MSEHGNSAGERGARIGWLGGFLGASCWIPLLAVVLGWQGDGRGAAVGLGWFSLAMGMAWWLRPWHWDGVGMGKLYLAVLFPILAAALFFLWHMGQTPEGRAELEGGSPWQLLILLPIFMPAVRWWRTSWSDQLRQGRGGGPALPPPGSGEGG